MSATPGRFPMTPRGALACDPRHAQVTFDYAGRHYLGDVRDAYYDGITGTVRLKVTHFNGEPWPVDPPARSVEVLERTHRCENVSDQGLTCGLPAGHKGAHNALAWAAPIRKEGAS